MDPFFAAAIAMAAQIAADPGAPSRRASFLRLEGAMLCAFAINSRRIFVYLRGEFGLGAVHPGPEECRAR